MYVGKTNIQNSFHGACVDVSDTWNAIRRRRTFFSTTRERDANNQVQLGPFIHQKSPSTNNDTGEYLSFNKQREKDRLGVFRYHTPLSTKPTHFKIFFGLEY